MSSRMRWLLAVLVAVIAVVALWPAPGARITLANFNRIRGGMTRPEVEAILGPPGYHQSIYTFTIRDSDAHKHHDFEEPVFVSGSVARPSCQWFNNTTLIMVWYDQSGTAVAADYWELGPANPTTLDKVIWELRRRRRK